MSLRYFSTFYVYFRILSLDVVLGAMLMCYLCAYFLNSYPGWESYASLGLAVWLIYTLDHLMDARKIPHQAHTRRHQFHQKYFNSLVLLSGLIALSGLGIAFFFLPRRVFIVGFYMGLLVFLHFLLTWIDQLKNTLLIQKETRTALIYCLGVATAPLSLRNQLPELVEILFILQIFLIAWINLLIISYFEEETDLQDTHISTVLKLGKTKTEKILMSLIFSHWILTFGCLFILSGAYRIKTLCILMSMSVILFLVFRQKKYFSIQERYRSYSDAVFYIPVFLIIWEYGSGF